MTRRQGTAHIVAALAPVIVAGALLAGCGTVGLFGEYDIPESPDVAAAPYPRLVDVPEAPPVGVYTAAVPDPATGARTLSELSTAAAVADVLARDAAGPVVARDGNGLAAAVARAEARSRALSGPVISEADRQAMLASARAQQERQDRHEQ